MKDELEAKFEADFEKASGDDKSHYDYHIMTAMVKRFKGAYGIGITEEQAERVYDLLAEGEQDVMVFREVLPGWLFDEDWMREIYTIYKGGGVR